MGGLSPQNARRRQWQAFGSALGLEMALVGALIAWVATHPPTRPEPVIPLSIESIAPAAPEKPSVPEKPKPAPQPEQQLPKQATRTTPPPQLAALPPPLSPPLSAPVPDLQATAPLPATPAPTPQALPAPVSAALPVTPPAAVPAVDPSPAYNAKLTAAAQAAFEVPGTVAALNFKGRARIGFKLRDGVASSIATIQSSGLGAMDRAAVKAVQTAAFPQPPPSFQGKEIAYEIWVTHTPAN